MLELKMVLLSYLSVQGHYSTILQVIVHVTICKRPSQHFTIGKTLMVTPTSYKMNSNGRHSFACQHNQMLDYALCPTAAGRQIMPCALQLQDVNLRPVPYSCR